MFKGKVFSREKKGLYRAGIIIAVGLILAGCSGFPANSSNLSNNLPSEESWELKGQVESLTSSQWVVSGKNLKVGPGTFIDNHPNPVVGSLVDVVGKTTGEGTLTASKIRVIIPLPGSTLTPLGTLTPLTEPLASETATPSLTLVGTASVTPNSTSGPTGLATPGSLVEIEGVVETVEVENDQTIVTINSRKYILHPGLVGIVRPYIIQGVPVRFTGRVDEDGQITIVDLSQLNNQLIKIENPPLDQPLNPQSKGNCGSQPDKGKCNGSMAGKEKEGSPKNNGKANGKK